MTDHSSIPKLKKPQAASRRMVSMLIALAIISSPVAFHSDAAHAGRATTKECVTRDGSIVSCLMIYTHSGSGMSIDIARADDKNCRVCRTRGIAVLVEIFESQGIKLMDMVMFAGESWRLRATSGVYQIKVSTYVTYGSNNTVTVRFGVTSSS
jgi:hypothetical protein